MSQQPPFENDPWAETRVMMSSTRPSYTNPAPQTTVYIRPRKRRSCCGFWGCSLAVLFTGGFLLVLAAYLFFPWQTNILLLGIDYTESWNFLGRSDTIILASVDPLAPEVRMLSIPRDLWVFIPGYGENRINTAHFFAEGEQPGNGPRKAIETVQSNFGVGIDYYVRVRFEGFRDVVNAMGGVDIVLDEPLAGYPPGSHHLTGNKALAFARSRMGADDFYRMEQGQIIIKAALRQMLQPAHWWQLPGVTVALLRSLDTNIPVWLLPRLGVALLRAGSDGIDNRTIQREMVTPFTTDQGASVLLPDWNRINPLLAEMFGQ